jgi:hypothetical protein
MTIISIMAAILEDELRDHGILELTRPVCEKLIHRMVERTAELEANIKQDQWNRTPAAGPDGLS